MKTTIVLLVFICTTNIYAQVGIGTSSPNTSSVLDLNSSTKGFLPPRMTLAERNAISTPAAGLMIWCTNCGGAGQLHFYDGLGWTPLLSTLTIGGSYGGGKVAYILQPGDPGYVVGERHGLIAAVSDQSTSAQWGCAGTNIPGAAGIVLGTGNQNTIDIVNGCASAGIAARICNDLVLGGYSDWYLPSKDELNKLYLNKIAIGGFANYDYWCSTEFDSQYAWIQYFLGGSQFSSFKGNINAYVRAVRAF